MAKTSFSDLIKSDQPVLVDFYADWCQPCHALSPIIERVSGKINHLTVIKVNLDKNQAASAKYQIRSIPTLILFHQGKILWRHSGVIAENKLFGTLQGLISKV